MVNPKKIGEEGRALTCDEYDENLDILQNRANHVGFQSCTTISDLDVCLASNPVITNIQGDIDSNTDRIVQIENDLDASGSIALSLQNIEATLSADIAQNAADIADIQDQIADNIIPAIDGNTSNLSTLTQTVTSNFNTLNTRLTSIDGGVNPSLGRMTIAENKINTNLASINTITGTTIPGVTQARINGDNALNTLITQANTTRSQQDQFLQDQIDDEIQDRIQDVNTVDSKFTIITNDLKTDLDNEIDDREDADTLLQAQINTLNAGLSSAIPTGTILAYAGTTAPSGFLFCHGGSYSRTTYSALFNVISTRYGSTNSTTFNLPDLRDKILYGNPTTNLNSGTTTEGANTVTLTNAQMPRHSHTIPSSTHSHSFNMDHWHGLTVKTHAHGINSLPPHSHSLYPFRNVALGGGDEDTTGAELTYIPSDDPDDPNIYFRTAELEANTIPGPSIHAAAVRIYPGTDTGINRTDGLPFGTPNTVTSTATIAANLTNETGGTTAVDLRQASLKVNYIIKT